MNRMKREVFRVWSKLPEGVRRKPLDVEISILLIMTALAGSNLNLFEPFEFLFVDSPFSYIIEIICSIYLLIGGILVIYGLFTHHKHNQILSFCKTELWGWRLITSAAAALFIAEFFFGTVTGVSLGSVIWLLQLIVGTLKLFQFYNEKSKEKQLWIS